MKLRTLLRLSLHSAWNRRFTLGLTLVAITLSICLLIGVERVRQDAKEGFDQAISGTDLVVGARTSPVQLMLYSVFRIGAATNNIRWESFRWLAEQPEVAWAIPLSLGDSHRGFPVLGTSSAYFEHFRYGRSRQLEFISGKPFSGIFEAVIGAEIADGLGYHLGHKIVLNHGMGDTGLADHADKPFTVVGVLARTGTPVDRTVHISLEALEAIHLDWQGGAPIPGLSIPPEYVTKFDLTPKEITSALIGLQNRAAVFKVQRTVNEYSKASLLAVMPGVALDELWQVVGMVERTLLAISAMVVAVGLTGMIAVVLASLNERRRELAILRSVGAKPRDIFTLLAMEAFAVALIGAFLGVVLLGVLTALMAPIVQAHFGLIIQLRVVSMTELTWLSAIIGAALLASLVPGYRAYKASLADGLSPRL
jgi:putative ABC transport system permease protein